MDKPKPTNEGEIERVVCVDVEKGKLIWEYVYQVDYARLDYGKGPRASVTIENGKAYGLGAMGHAFCLDAKNGEEIWFRNLAVEENCPPPIWGYSSTPEPLGEFMLYHVGGKDGNILALSPSNGKTKWRVGGDKKAGYAPPLVVREGAQPQLICWGPNRIMGLPIGGGNELWSIPYEVKYGVSIAKPIFVDGIVLVCGYWNGSRAISVGKKGGRASLLWSEEDRLRGLMAQPLHREGIIYLLDRSHGLTAFELKSGNILWRDEHELTTAGRNPHASLVWLGEKGGDALSLNAEGELVYLSLTATGCREYWREQVVGETWAHPAYSGNKILARDDRSLYCWELPLLNP
jgi:outer membrane protein assembly factor BamB